MMISEMIRRIGPQSIAPQPIAQAHALARSEPPRV